MLNASYCNATFCYNLDKGKAASREACVNVCDEDSC